MKRSLSYLLLSLLPATLFGFSVNPMVANLDPSASRAQQVYVLTNTSDEDKPIDISVAKPQIGDDNIETLIAGEGEDLFLIIPQQLILPANSRRSVKVFYVGDPLENEETYRILFKQIPVELDTPDNSEATETTVDMKIVLEYHTRVWLTPGGLKPQLSITNFSEGEKVLPRDKSGVELADQDPIPTLDLTIENEGLCHGYIRHPQLLVRTIDGKSHSIDKDMLRPINGQVVMKGNSKKFRLSWNESLPPINTIKDLRLKTKNP